MLTNKQLCEAVCGFVRLIKANALGAQIVCHFDVTDLKKGTAKNRSEAYVKFYDPITQKWRVSKVTHYKNVTFQRSYLGAVENRSDSPLPYNLEPPKGKHWVEGCEGILLQADADESKYYLRISENKNTERLTTYYVDGRQATNDEVDLIKAYSPKKDYACKKQIDYGVDADHQVIVKDITLTNIVSIKFGDKVLNLR